LDRLVFAFYSLHPASLTQLDSGFNIQVFQVFEMSMFEMFCMASSIRVIALSIPGINAEAFRAGMVTSGWRGRIRQQLCVPNPDRTVPPYSRQSKAGGQDLPQIP
jgi:hypothetical protein